MKTDVIIPSAGSGTRMNCNKNKLFLPMADGKSVIYNTVNAFLLFPDTNNVIIPCKEEEREEILSILSPLNAEDRIILSKGGLTRTESVQNALSLVKTTHVLIHDGARPFIDHQTIRRVLDKTISLGACIPVVPPQDTIKEVDGDKVVSTLDRNRLAGVQTPQGFITEKLQKAYSALKANKTYTDDASVYEEVGTVYTVLGNKENVKITTPEDMSYEYRSGVGFDAHRLVEGRKLILGGIEIPHTRGLLGHSDADVVLHALMDALLSSVRLRDIGYHFPCTEEFKDASSVDLLNRVLSMVKEKDATIINASIVIVAEKPKLAPHVDNIANNIADLLSIDRSRVSVGATTTEKLGFTGREEGIACEAIVSIKL